MARLADGHLPFLHRFQQSGLRLGRSSIDFVCENHVVKQRSGDKSKLSFARIAVLLQNVSPSDVGRHQIRGKLNTREAHRQTSSQRADHQGFSQSRNPFQQTVTTAEERDQQLLDDIVLANDDFGHLIADRLIRCTKFCNGGFDIGL